MSKKIVAMLMAVAMAFSLLPVTAFATGGPSATTTKDVVYGHYNDEGNWEFGKPGNAIPGSLKDTVTTVDKTAEKLADNQYEVTLKVEMKQKKTAVPPGAAATVLVIDTSGSMKYCTKEEHQHTDDCYQWAECTPQVNPNHYRDWDGGHKILDTNCKYKDGRYIYPALQTCGKEEHEHNSDNCKAPYRIDAAKEAAENFLKSYRGGTVSNGNWDPSTTPLKRYVSIVSFNIGASKSDWVDVSTQDGYNTAIRSIEALSANGGTNLDAGLRMANAQLGDSKVTSMPANVVVLTDSKPTFYLGDQEYIDGDYYYWPDIRWVKVGEITYRVHGKGSQCNDATYTTTVSTAKALKQAASVYTVCFGASNEKLEAKDKPTVSKFLRTNIATQQAEGKKYAYDANNATELYNAFAAISSSVVSGLNTGTVEDALPAGVSCTKDGIFDDSRRLTWELKADDASESEADENGFITYTYEKKYTVEIDPTANGLNVVNGYVPLNQPTTLTVQNNGKEVKIPFPIPAGKVTYSLTDFKKELVTNQNKPGDLTISSNITIPNDANSTVTVGENGVTLLYKITVQGNAGAKFTVTDTGATLVSPTDSSITFNQEGSTFSGTVGTTGETVFYVSKQFTKNDISRDTKTVSNTATIAPGDNANGPDNKKTTVTTPAKEPDSQNYTVTYQWATGKEIPSDAALPEGNPFMLSVGAKHTVATTPTSNIKANSKGETGKWTCSWDKSDVIEGSAGEQVVITGTWTFTKQEIEPTPDTSKPDVNKTATALVNDKTDVTLSVGGKSAKENVAVMFLLDKSTSMGTRQEAAKMLQHLKGLTNTNIIYDVVIFSGTASSTGWKDISNDAAYTDTQENFNNKEPSSGTNMPVGIDQAIQDMNTLKSQYSTYAENAYLITISDGITYLWNEEGKTYTVPLLQKEGDNVYTPAHVNVDTWDMMHGKGTPIASVYTSFEGFLNTIPGKIAETRNGNYVREYLTETDAGDKTDATNALQISTADPEKSQVSSKYACAPEFSVYYSATKYQELVKQFEKSFALPMPELDNNNQNKMDNWESWYPWGKELMLYLQSNSSNSGQGVVYAADAEEIFAGIQNKILYQIQSGSITDVIGADFSLTDQTLTQNTFTLTVNGKAVTANAPSGNVITFGEKDKSTGKYPYMLTYYKGTATKNADNTYTITSGEKTYTYTPYDTNGEVNGSVSDEFFVLEMNVPVVSLDLKYNLSLTSKRTSTGTYEVPTNESATLAYTSANQSGGTVDFNEPTVSYTVKSSSGSHSGGSRPSLNTKDHYGYIIGYPVDYYTGQPTTDQTKKPVRPEGKITRAEVATIYFRMLTDESRTKFWSQSNSYSDVKTGDWFNNAVSTLSNAGIIAGYEDGSFRPNGYITRAEFATIAARFFDVTYNGKDLFPDISGHWAKDYINQAANKGFVNGYEDGTFKPDRNITRAEAVTLVNRTLDRHPDKSHFTKDMLVWPDNMDQTKWYYADMQEATNSHTYQMKENSDKTKYENWTKTLPIRNWEALEKAWSNANSSQGNGNVV